MALDDTKSDFKVVGTRPARPDGLDKATGRAKFVSTGNSFHGRTLGALSVIGQPKYHDPYRALLREPVVVPSDAPACA